VGTVGGVPPSPRGRGLRAGACAAFLLLYASGVRAQAGALAPPAVVSSREVMERGQAFAAARQYDRAVAAYREYLATHPADDEVRGALARVLSWQGDYDGDVSLYEDILTRHPVDLEVRVALGRVKSWQKKFAEARRIYEGVLNEEPQNAEAKRGLADTLYWSGAYAPALGLYEEIFAATADPEVAQRIQAVKSELSEAAARQSPRAPIGEEKPGPSLPYRDYFKIGYGHFTYTKNNPDERDWLFEAAKPLGARTLVARVEALDRFGSHDTLLSGELYSPLWEKAWGYLGGALGVDPQFTPRWTLGGEIFQGLGIVYPALSPLEPSFGYRRMSFRGADINLLVPGCTVYFPHDIWLTEKGYLVPDNNSQSLSSALTWRVSDRLQVYASGTFGTVSERILAPQDFTRTDTRVLQGGLTFPLARRLSAEVWGYYEDRHRQYIRRGGSFALLLHW